MQGQLGRQLGFCCHLEIVREAGYVGRLDVPVGVFVADGKNVHRIVADYSTQ